MYDERTRYLQAYSSFLATVEKEKKDARMQGLAEGKAEGIAEGIEKGKVHGIEHGKKMIIINLIKDGLLSKEEGAKRLSISFYDFYGENLYSYIHEYILHLNHDHDGLLYV